MLTVTATKPTVVVIDGDESIGEALGSLVRSVGFQAKLLASAGGFLKSGRPDGPACLVLDVGCPDKAALIFNVSSRR